MSDTFQPRHPLTCFDIRLALVLTVVLVMKVCHVMNKKIVNGSSELENRNAIIPTELFFNSVIIASRNVIQKTFKLPSE